MSKTKHTDGPWRVVKDGSHGTIESAAGKMVAQAQQLSAPAGLDKVRLANARLIAAAPDLLDALVMQEKAESLKRQMESINKLNDEYFGAKVRWERAESCAAIYRKTAMAKATGADHD